MLWMCIRQDGQKGQESIMFNLVGERQKCKVSYRCLVVSPNAPVHFKEMDNCTLFSIYIECCSMEG